MASNDDVVSHEPGVTHGEQAIGAAEAEHHVDHHGSAAHLTGTEPGAAHGPGEGSYAPSISTSSIAASSISIPVLEVDRDVRLHPTVELLSTDSRTE